MNRIEENKLIVDFMTEKAMKLPSAPHEEMVAFQLGAIATLLADISKSLAIIADNATKEGE